MAVQLYRRRRTVAVPPWFWLWLLFVVWSLAGFVLLGQTAPGTLVSSLGTRIPAYGLRSLQYLGATIALLYVGNLDEREVPRERIVRWMGILGVVTVIGGYAGMLLPRFSFTSPTELVLNAVSGGGVKRGLQILVHPAFAQIQSVIGAADARPKAPFEFTNAWGNNVSVLLAWVVVGYMVYGTRRSRIFGAGLLVASIVPIIYSLNRGLWIGIGLMFLYIVCRLAFAGRPWLLGLLAAGLVCGAAILAVTPLGTVISARLHNGDSNEVRTSLTQTSIATTLSSPIVGYGSTRDGVGSDQSIAIGATTDCPRCGNRTIGSNGQLWNVLFSEGYVGAAIYVAFFVLTLLFYRRDITPIGLAGESAVLLSLLYMLVYVAISSALTITVLSIALLWRNDMAKKSGLPDPVARAEPRRRQVVRVRPLSLATPRVDA
jgi:magnesium-transporting ATPase (P-type)